MKWLIKIMLIVVGALSLIGCTTLSAGMQVTGTISQAQTDPETDNDDAYLLERLDETFISDTSALVEIETYRDNTPDSEERVTANLARIQRYLNERVASFNSEQETLFLEPFEWREEIEGVDRWVFGYRLGDGPRKFAVLTHMDTVPPGNDSWDPFTPRVETKSYRGGEQPFLIGRGAVDDKGPGVIALTVLEAAARRFDGMAPGEGPLQDWTLEVSFDTAEETDMSMPFYINAVGEPELGIVFDAYWCVYAEKGGERPVFTMPLGETGPGALWIAELATPDAAVNQIPDRATTRIEGSDAALAQFADEVQTRYEAYGFDDPDYRRAPMEIARIDGAVLITTTVMGAQHASVPYENRAEGANPLVSLANFLAGLADDGTLAANGYTRMARFMAWGWGTEVFGEKHTQLLQRFDPIFTEGNGTTYALTRLTTRDETVRLAIDIRYALGHHSTPYVGDVQGQLAGDSIFPQVFDALVDQYNEVVPDAGLGYTTATLFAPDVRDPDGAHLQIVSDGYAAVTGEACPAASIGGGTDAKGHPTLVAAGALFSDDFGPPINYHGLEEGAPIDDLRQSARILYQILLTTVAETAEPGSTAAKSADTDAAPVKIGVLSPTSGPLATFGQDVNSGIALFWQRVGNAPGTRPVELFFADTAGDPQQALDEAQRLVEQEGVDLLMGVVNSEVAPAVAAFADAQQIPLVITIAGAADVTGPARSPFVFRTAMANGQQEGPLAHYLVTESGAQTAAIVAWDSAAGAERSSAFATAFTAAGGTVVTEQQVPLDTTDFAPYLDILLDVQAENEVDVVYTFLAGPSAVRFVQEMRQREGLATQTLAGTGYLTAGVLQQMGTDALPMVQGAEYTPAIDTPATDTPAIDNPAHNEFVTWLLDDSTDELPTSDATYAEKVRAASDVYIVEGYLSASVVAQALEAPGNDAGGDTSDPSALAQALANVNFESVSGPFRFDESGQAVRALYITQLVESEDGTLEPTLVTVIPDVVQQ